MSSSAPNFSQYRTVSEAADFLGVTAATLRNWDRNGKLKPRRHPQNGYRIYLHEDLEAILRSAEFSNDRAQALAPPCDWPQIGECEHFVQFYENDDFLTDSLTAFIGTALRDRHSAVVIGTQPHRSDVHRKLLKCGIDVTRAVESGRYVALDARDTLSRFMVDGSPDPRRFGEVIGPVIARLSHAGGPVHAFGEMVALLWQEGQRAAAIRLEELWNELRKTHQFSLCCAYPIAMFTDTADTLSVDQVCRCHSRVFPAESYLAEADPDERLRAVTLLQQKAQSLEAEIAHRREVEKSLVARERDAAMLAAIIESSEDAIISKSLDGVIRSWNRGAEQMFGYTGAEALGRPITLIIPPERLDEEGQILALLRRGERIEHFETVRVAKSGRRIDISLSISPLRDADGNLIGASKIARDITDRKRVEGTLREREGRLRAMVDQAAVGIVLCDPAGKILEVNPRFCEILGRGAEELCGITCRELTHPDDWSQSEPLMQEVARGDRPELTVEKRYARGKNSWVWVKVSITPIVDAKGRVQRLLSVVEDIDARKRAEQALSEADRRKDEFLATLAHELRNPLAPLKNGLELMRLGAGDEQSVAEVRRLMERQVQHLSRLVDDLLDLSRISRGKIELRQESVELAGVIQSAVETSRPAIDARGHHLAVRLPDEPIVLTADPTRLAQVFANLLNNSAKYTPPGGRIEIEACRQRKHVVVTVRDSGIGIECNDLAHVFEMFRQVDQSMERGQGGLGIGLTLVRRLVELHGGKVSAQSEGLGKGSEFVVRLPLGPRPKPPASAAAKNETPSLSNRRILVVDDNADSRATLRRLLEVKGNQVQVACDGLEAIAVADEIRPEIILMDIGMPRLNGYDATRAIRQKAWAKDVIIIALSGWGQSQDVERAQQAGCSGHLTKPVDFKRLERIVSAAAPPGG